MMTAIERLRRDKGWTQARLATEANVGRYTVTYAERRKHAPRIETLSKLAAALGVPARILLADFAPDIEQPA